MNSWQIFNLILLCGFVGLYASGVFIVIKFILSIPLVEWIMATMVIGAASIGIISLPVVLIIFVVLFMALVVLPWNIVLYFWDEINL